VQQKILRVCPEKKSRILPTPGSVGAKINPQGISKVKTASFSSDLAGLVLPCSTNFANSEVHLTFLY
jgi:hypothetical protein